MGKLNANSWKIVVLICCVGLFMGACAPQDKEVPTLAMLPTMESSPTAHIPLATEVPKTEVSLNPLDYQLSATEIPETNPLLIPTAQDLTQPALDEVSNGEIPETQEPATAILISESIVQPVPQQVVIQFDASASQQEREAYVKSVGGVIVSSITSLDTVVVNVPEAMTLNDLPQSDIVVLNEPDYYASALFDISTPTSDPYYDQQWSLEAMDFPAIWQELPDDLPPVTVAVIDSGICLNHPDLEGRILDNGSDFVDDDDIPQDELGHGCAVAGIIAANIDNGIGIAGVAPNAQIMPLRVLDASGLGSYSDVASAIVYAVNHGADIINLSLGGINPSSVLENAVDYAVSHKVTVVAAVGNDGMERALYPANYDDVIAVGASDRDVKIASFSNYGDQVDEYAPGQDILTTDINNDYVLMTGTSFAAPHVVGALVNSLTSSPTDIVLTPETVEIETAEESASNSNDVSAQVLVAKPVTFIRQASGIDVDAFAIEEMLIEYIKARPMSQTDLEDIVTSLIQNGDTDEWLASQMIDDMLRAHGVPVEQVPIYSGATLESLIIQSIDNDLPVVLMGIDHQVIVDGYQTSPFSVHVLDPSDTTDKWSPLAGMSLSNPSITVREILHIPHSVHLSTDAYGTVTYYPQSDILSGGPSDGRLKEALKSTTPYARDGYRAVILDYGDTSSELGTYIAMLNSDQLTGVAGAAGTLSAWEGWLISNNADFPLLPFDSNGYLVFQDIEKRTQDLSLFYRIHPYYTVPLTSRSYITPDESDRLDATFDQMWFYHTPPFDNTWNESLYFDEVITNIVSSRNRPLFDRSSKYSTMLTSYEWVMEKISQVKEVGELSKELIETVDTSLVYIESFNKLRADGENVKDSMLMADNIARNHASLKTLFGQAKLRGKPFKLPWGSIVSSTLGKLLVAAEPISFIEDAEQDLIIMRDKLNAKGIHSDLADAIDGVLTRLQDEKRTLFDIFVDALWDGSFAVEMADIALHAVVEWVADNWVVTIPIVGQFYIMAKLTFVGLEILTNGEGVDAELRHAVVARDISHIFHDLAYDDARNQLKNRFNSNSDVPLSELQYWDSAARMTYLAETYSRGKLAEAFNVQGLLSNLMMSWRYGYGSGVDIAENYLMPEALQAAEFARLWRDAGVVESVSATTNQLLFDTNVTELIAVITTIDNELPDPSGLTVSGIVTFEYTINGVHPPFSVGWTADGFPQPPAVPSLDNGTYVWDWNATAWHDGENHTIKLRVTDSQGNVTEQSVVVQVGEDSGPAPEITLTSPNSQDNQAFSYFKIEWTDYADGDAVITLGYDQVGSGCNGTEIQSWIQEDWVTDYWVWRNIPGSSNTQYYIYGIIDDGNTQTCDYADVPLTIETPTSGDYFDVVNVEIDDTDDGNGNGAWEAGERVELRPIIINKSSSFVNDVLGVATPQDNRIAQNDPEDGYWAMDPGETDDHGVMEYTVSEGFDDTVTFDLYIYFRVNGGALRVDHQTFDVDIVPAGAKPVFIIDSITYTDSDLTEADNDGIPESGEDDILVDIVLKNVGNAEATYVYAVIDPPTIARWGSDDRDYPNIPINGTASPELPFRLDDIPLDFADTIDQTMTVYYGPDQTEQQVINFETDIIAVPRLKLLPELYSFGLVSPGTPVTYDFEVKNLGSTVANITGITTSDPALTFTNVPSTISAGGSAMITANLDTNALFGTVVTTFTVESDAHILSKNAGQLSGTVAFVSPASYNMIQSIPLDDVDYIEGGDTDGDGLNEIIVAEFVDVAENDEDHILRIYEQTALNSETFSQVWSYQVQRAAWDREALAVGDVTGDGKDDIVFAGDSFDDDIDADTLYLFTSSGNNSWTLRWSTAIESQAPVIGNADNDGFMDIVVLKEPKSSLGSPPPAAYMSVYEWNGSGMSLIYTSPAIYEEASYPNIEDADNSELCGTNIADTDTDGNNEIIFGNYSGQLIIFERTGNNSFTRRYHQEITTSSSNDPCHIAVGDADNDGKPEIAHGDDDGTYGEYMRIIESTGNDSWTKIWEEIVATTTGDEITTLDYADIDLDGWGEWFIGTNASTLNENVLVYEAFTNNGYAKVYGDSDSTFQVTDDVTDISFVQANDTPEIEFLVAGPYMDDASFYIFGLVAPKDIVVTNSDIAFSTDPVEENEVFTVTANVSNNSDVDVNDVVVRFYNGDPDSGGVLLDTDTIVSIAPSSVGLATIDSSLATEGTVNIYVIVDADDNINEVNENNNQANKSIVVKDDDINSPSIHNVGITEQAGDSDGLLEDNEQIQVTWSVSDDTGIQSSALSVISGTCSIASSSHIGNDYVTILGPCGIGDYQIEITVEDSDNSPLSATDSAPFTVVPHQPQIVSISPLNNETNVSRYAVLAVTFGTDMLTNSISTNSFIVKRLSDNQIASGSMTFDLDENKAQFTPDYPLRAGDDYQVTLVSGVDGIKDSNENPLDSDYSWTFSTVANQAPFAPSNPNPLSGSTDKSNNLVLTWQGSDPENDPLTYDILIGTSNPPALLICDNISQSACNISDLDFSQLYYWQVVASDGRATTMGSIWQFTTEPKPLPAPPALLEPSPSGITTNDNTPNFEWGDVDLAFDYQIQVDNDNSFASPILNIVTSLLTHIPGVPLSDGMYYWRVRAIDDENDPGAWSDVWLFTVDTTPPPIPLLFAPSNNTVFYPSNSPTYSWQSVPEAAQYEIQLDNVNPPQATVQDSSKTTYELPTESVVGTYYWRVRAKDDFNNLSGWSEIRTVNIISPENASPGLYLFDTNTPTISWNRVTGATEYEVEVSTDSKFIQPPSFSAVVPGDTLYVVPTSLDNGTYYWRVRAKNSTNVGSWSVVGSFIVNAS